MSKKHKYPQVIQLPFKSDDFIRKKNGSLFNMGYFKKRFVPTLLVKHAYRINESKWIINNHYYFDSIDDIVIIDLDKHIKLTNLFNELKLSEPESLSVEETCYTTYSGARTEKMKYKYEDVVLHSLYRFILTRPDEIFQAYKCPNCDAYHIGRIVKKEENV